MVEDGRHGGKFNFVRGVCSGENRVRVIVMSEIGQRGSVCFEDFSHDALTVGKDKTSEKGQER
jgi:ubiquinone/menaquinone biosynthesis C-methylase UbiE